MVTRAYDDAAIQEMVQETAIQAYLDYAMLTMLIYDISNSFSP